MQNRIFVCDDEEGMRRYLIKMLSRWGYHVEAFESPAALLEKLEETEIDNVLLLLDIRMPEMDGIEVLRRARDMKPGVTVVMMTGHATVQSAVDAMKLGAWDYLVKPFPQEKLQALVKHCFENAHLMEENLSLKRELRDKTIPCHLVFESERFREVHELALRVSGTDSSVLILGESGTGKELIANTIHEASPRAAGRFLAVNCAAFSETLLESQLFGHVKGAFTGAVQSSKGLLEEAHQGTLFLDEVGDLSPSLQAKLLRVLQEGEFIPVGSTRARRVDVRFLAATNKNLEEEVTRGNFREDLYYRLNVISLELPPLRERPEDVLPLALHFLKGLAQKTRRKIEGIEEGAVMALMQYHWPGNVRELQNVIERGVILARSNSITLADLPIQLTGNRLAETGPESSTALPLNLRQTEKLQIARALSQTDWNKSHAARLLGVSRKTLDRKIQEFGMTPESVDSAT